MEHMVDAAEMKISSDPDDVLSTPDLGSCLGLSIYDPVSKVGGLLHLIRPNSSEDPDEAKSNPFMYVDSGVPLFFKAAYAEGAVKVRLVVKVAGGADMDESEDEPSVGRQNFVTLRKLFWKNGVMIAGEDTGGTIPRKMSLDVNTGAVLLSSDSNEWNV